MQRANTDLAPKPPTMARIVEINRGPLLGELPRARTVVAARRRRPGAGRARRRALRRAATWRARSTTRSRCTGFGNRCGFALDPEREVVIVAASHEQAADAARKLAAVGFTQLAEVGFGIDAAHCARALRADRPGRDGPARR